MCKPNPDLAGLTEEELRLYENASAMCDESVGPEYDVMVTEALESLAASRATAERRRALLRKVEQYVKDEFRGMAFDEEQEREWRQKGQDLLTALAAELRGGG